MKKSLIFSIAVMVTLFSGCSTKAPEIDGIGSSSNGGLGNAIGGVGADGNIDGMAQMDSSSVSYGSEDEKFTAIENELKTIYFGTDRYDISATESEKIDGDVTVLNGPLAGDLSAKVEGSCDEWGTDEYNFALGLKRAKSTKDALIAGGVDADRLSIISYGESKPKCFEHNAECWQQNRRADIKVFAQ